MRTIIVTLLGAALIIGGYTFWWNQIADTALVQAEHWKEEKLAAGYEIANSPIEVSGFPYRIKLFVNQMTIKTPDGKYPAKAQINNFWAVAQPWNISHAVFGVDGTIEAMWQENETTKTATVTSDSARGSATFDLQGKVQKAAVDVGKLIIAPSWQDPVHADRLQIHSRPAPIPPKEEEAPTANGPAQQIAIQIDQLDLGEKNTSVGSSIFEKVVLSGIFQGHWQDLKSKSSITKWRDNGGIIDMQDITAQWGDSRLAATGTVALDDEYRPIGAFTAHIVGFNPILDAIIQAKKLDKKASQTVAFALNILAKENKKGEKYLDIPLTLQEGGVYLGPLFLMTVDPVF